MFYNPIQCILAYLASTLLLEYAIAILGHKRDLIIIGGDEGCPPKLILKTGGKHDEDILLMPTCHRYQHNEKYDKYPKAKLVKHIHYSVPSHHKSNGHHDDHCHHHHHHHGHKHKTYYDDSGYDEELSPMEIYDADTEVAEDKKEEKSKKLMQKLNDDTDNVETK